jgi:hypothetical protein
MNNYDATVAERRAAFWARIQKHQPIADENFFGDEWRALIQTRTMEAAKAAAFQVYLVRLSVTDDDSEEACNLDQMQRQTRVVMHDLQRKVAA